MTLPIVKSAVAGEKLGARARERQRMTGRAYVFRVVRGRRASEGDSRLKEEGGESAGPSYRKA